jgi:16S rRNA (guanine966-N2)-methyltransferase
MRIISGSAKGISIRAPKNLPARPTTDRCKESIFNIIGTYFDFTSLSVLDLFSGTGNMSFEFASRGCKQVISVDQNFHCCDFIKSQQKQLNFENIRVIKSEVMRFLKNSIGNFDLIFADPPYDFQQYDELLNTIFHKNLLSEKGWFMLEHSSAWDFKSHQNFSEKRTYGQTIISIFKE